MANTIFGQFVVGPPGSGKSTYCKFICENLKQLGRNAKIINLDPANDCLPYKPSIDLTDLVSVQVLMEKEGIGPNGAMIRCMEILCENFPWLYDNMVILMKDEEEKFKKFEMDKKKELDSDKDKPSSQSEELVATANNRPYLIFDCPGQSELYTHLTVMRDITRKLTSRKYKHFDLRLVCLNLCDSYHASDPGKYIGLVMNSLSTMFNLELPHLNILSKVDKIESYGKTRFNLDFYCEVMDLKYLLETELESPFYQKYKKLSEKITAVIEDHGLVHFIPLNIQQAEDIHRVLQQADKANGYYVDDLDLSILQLNPRLMEMASGRRLDSLNDATIYQI